MAYFHFKSFSSQVKPILNRNRGHQGKKKSKGTVAIKLETVDQMSPILQTVASGELCSQIETVTGYISDNGAELPIKPYTVPQSCTEIVLLL